MRIRPGRLGDGSEFPKLLGGVQRGQCRTRRADDAGAAPEENRAADANESVDFRLLGDLEVTGNEHEPVKAGGRPKGRIPGNQQDALALPSIHD